MICYASKAFSCKEMYRIIKSLGIGIDIVSGGELYTAKSVSFPLEKACFHGNNKLKSELNLAIENKVGYVVVDAFSEVDVIDEICAKKGICQSVLIRVNPGVEAHTHHFIQTANIDSKFGFSIENGDAKNIIEYVLSKKNVVLKGLHCHIGSQIFETEPFSLAADVMIGFAKKIQTEQGATFSEMNFGGGFGIKYLESDDPIEKSTSIEVLTNAVKRVCENENYPLPTLVIEPGRSIVGASNLTLYKVGAVKTIKDVRTYVSVDGGMSDNPRYALYKADYEIIIANKANEPRDFVATLAGKCCESGDLIQEHTKMQKAEVGDTLAVLATGAYNYSMASNYNRIRRPAAVMVKDGQARLIINRETYEDIIKNDI